MGRKLTQSSTDAVAKLELSMVEQKLVDINGWSSTRVQRAMEEYRNFLRRLQTSFPDIQPENPDPDVDEVWHWHILHTHRYMEDCQQLFGRYLHHMPKEVSVNQRRLTPSSSGPHCCPG